ncbi:MAG TPA: MerR family transcriptional regulator [Chloroflexota bacterium]|nr:MerR family transcriptional regulator [Chloroflexota bacterium]
MAARNRVKSLLPVVSLNFSNSGDLYKSESKALGKTTHSRKNGPPAPSRQRQERRYTLPVDRGSGYLQIGEAANRAGLTQRTLRYYEELGLLKPASRMEGGFRLYSAEDIDRIEYIKNLRDVLGFTLAEIKDMIEFEDVRSQLKSELHNAENREQRHSQLVRLKEVAQRQMRIVNEKRQRLKEMRTGIQARIDRIESQLQELAEREPVSS